MLQKSGMGKFFRFRLAFLTIFCNACVISLRLFSTVPMLSWPLRMTPIDSAFHNMCVSGLRIM